MSEKEESMVVKQMIQNYPVVSEKENFEKVYDVGRRTQSDG